MKMRKLNGVIPVLQSFFRNSDLDKQLNKNISSF